MAPKVQHFEITSKDFVKAQAFYKNVFEWEINDHDGDYALVSAGGDDAIGGGIGKAHEGQSPRVTFYVTVDNLQSYLDKVEAAGGKTILPPTPIEGAGECAMFTDLDGNVLGLYKSGKA